MFGETKILPFLAGPTRREMRGAINLYWLVYYLTQPMDPEKQGLNFIFPTKYGIPKSLKG